MVTDHNTKAAYDKAQSRARDFGGASRVTDLGDNKYSVLSSGGDQFYTVTVVERCFQHFYMCSCIAGQKGTGLCWHRGSVMAYRNMVAMKAAVVVEPEPDRLICDRCGRDMHPYDWCTACDTDVNEMERQKAQDELWREGKSWERPVRRLSAREELWGVEAYR